MSLANPHTNQCASGAQIACDAVDNVKQVLTRFSGPELVERLNGGATLIQKAAATERPSEVQRAREMLADEESQKKISTKRAIISALLAHNYSRGVTFKQLSKSEMDIQKMLKYSSTNTDSITPESMQGDPNKLRIAVSEQLGLFFSHYVEARLIDNEATCLVIYVIRNTEEVRSNPPKRMDNVQRTIVEAFKAPKTPTQPNIPKPFFLIVYPNTDFVLHNGVPTELKQSLAHCLLVAAKCESIEETELEGKDASALASLHLQKDAQGPYAIYRSGLADQGPLSRSKKARLAIDAESKGVAPHELAMSDATEARKTVDEVEESVAKKLRTDHGEKVLEEVVEHQEENKKTIEITDKTFGVAVDNLVVKEASMPAVQRIEFSVSADIGVEIVEDGETRTTDIPLPMRVRFEGTNIMNGIRELVQENILTPPIPSHLSNLSSGGTTRISLTETKEEEDGEETA